LNETQRILNVSGGELGDMIRLVTEWLSPAHDSLPLVTSSSSVEETSVIVSVPAAIHFLETQQVAEASLQIYWKGRVTAGLRPPDEKRDVHQSAAADYLAHLVPRAQQDLLHFADDLPTVMSGAIPDLSKLETELRRASETLATNRENLLRFREQEGSGADKYQHVDVAFAQVIMLLFN
jgi:hypothetical protein